MAVVFTIPESDQRYTYPEGLADVTFDQFVGYLDLLEKEPEQLKRLRESYTKEGELDLEAQAQARRFQVQLVDGEGGLELVRRILTKVRGSRARAELDNLVTQYEQARTERERAAQSIDKSYQANEVLPYFARVVSHFTGLDYDLITQDMNVEDLQGLYWVCLKALEDTNGQTEWSGSKVIEFEGIKYELPERFLSNGTVIEFMESAQYQKAMDKVKGGYWRSLIDVVSVLLRKPGEKYSDEVYQRNRSNFGRMTMDKVMDIGFFLRRRSEKLGINFLTSMAVQKLTNLKQGLVS